MTIDTSREAVERLLTNVTPGPWRVGPVDDCRVEDADGNEVSQIDGDYNHPDLWPIMEANARFIAAARELVPALLARAESAEAEVARLTAERDEADRRAGAAERGWEADKETLATYRRHLDKLKEERGYNPNVSFDTVWKETCAKADAALILAPDTLRQVREALEGITGHDALQDPEYMSESLNDALAACRAALALLTKE